MTFNSLSLFSLRYHLACCLLTSSRYSTAHARSVCSRARLTQVLCPRDQFFLLIYDFISFIYSVCYWKYSVIMDRINFTVNGDRYSLSKLLFFFLIIEVVFSDKPVHIKLRFSTSLPGVVMRANILVATCKRGS